MVHNVSKFNIKKKQKCSQDGSVHSVSFFSLFQYSTPWEKFILAVGIVACSITGITQAVNALNFCELADAMITYGGLNETSDKDNETFRQAIIQYAISDGLVIVSYLIFKYAAIVSFNYVACNQVLRMRGLLFEAIMNWDVSWFDLNPSGELGSRINEDLARVEDGIGEKIPMYCQYIIAFISSMILCFIYGWELTLVCVLPAPFLFGLLFYITSNTAKQAKMSFNALAQAGAVAEEVFSGIRTVQAFDGKEKEIERYNEKIRHAQRESQKRELMSALFNGLQWIFFCMLNGLGVWYGIRLIVKQRHWDPEDIVYTPKTTLIVFYAISLSITHISLSSIFIETLAAAQAAGAKVLHLIKQVANIDPRANRGLMPSSCQGEISFRNVYFKYPSRPDVKVLRGFNLTMQRGEVVAIVGHSGCGKSTCIQLLQRFYDPDEGEIALDGIEIRSLNVNWLRDRIGVVGQEPVLFGTTVYENIRYGREDATGDEIEQAAKIANAHDFILTLPQGYKTQVGERGTQLSGGQKQRIAIARALVRNPCILLLDEATSALDIKNEAKVQEALEKASKGRTTIIVAHRLSTIRNADKIVVMDKGQVVEMGSHHELMIKNGTYYQMVMNQTNLEISSPGSESPSAVIENERDYDEKAMSERGTSEDESKTETDTSLKPANTLQLLKFHSSDWPLLTLGCISAFLAGAAIPLFAEALGGFVGGLKYHDDETLLWNGKLFAFLWVGMGFLTGVFLFLHSYVLGLAAESLTKYVRGLCFKAMLSQEMAWFDDKKNGTGMLCARLSAEAAALHHATGSRIGSILMATGIIVVSFGLTIMHKWQMTFIAILFMPPIYITIWAEKKIRHRESVMKVEALGMSTKLVVEVISNMRTVISLGRQKLFLKQYMDLLVPAAKRQKVNMHVRGVCFALTSSLTTVVLLPMLCYGCTLVLQGELTIEHAITIARAWATATVLVSNYMAYTPNVQRGLMAAANIFSLLKRQPKIMDSKEIYRNIKSESKGFIKFDSIDFSYPSSADTKILRQLSLDVSQGQSIALVGPSGCGKSTCIQLLQRFYDVDVGKVSIDSQDVRSKTLQNLRFELGIVSQEATLFNRTIAENIAYGDNTRNVSVQEIVDAAKNANIHNFISSLPQGYETPVGDKGTQLSGGQKQRIAIARALVRNPKILLLDEATSALDIESEKVVQAALDLAKQGRTCITIAHRLATIIDVDVIYVMKNGQIVERGAHKELLQKRGIYYGLYKSQNSRDVWK